MTQVTIAKEVFAIPSRYEAGHTINEAEANTLNQTLLENIRNNLAGKIKKLQEAEGFAGLDSKIAEGEDAGKTYREVFQAYADNYEFGVRASGGTREPVDPVQREARRMAREMIASALKAKGAKVKDLPAEKLEEMIATVAGRDQVQKEAKRRVNASASIGLDELGLGGETQEGAEA